MADILIRGMEMPKGCGVCPFRDDECFGAWKCWRVKDWGDDDSRAKGCPLIHIPAGHGRLGDLDILFEVMGQDADRWIVDEVSMIETDDVLDAIQNAPTIVPAEGGNADGN